MKDPRIKHPHGRDTIFPEFLDMFIFNSYSHDDILNTVIFPPCQRSYKFEKKYYIYRFLSDSKNISITLLSAFFQTSKRLVGIKRRRKNSK